METDEGMNIDLDSPKALVTENYEFLQIDNPIPSFGFNSNINSSDSNSDSDSDNDIEDLDKNINFEMTVNNFFHSVWLKNDDDVETEIKEEFKTIFTEEKDSKSESFLNALELFINSQIELLNENIKRYYTRTQEIRNILKSILVSILVNYNEFIDGSGNIVLVPGSNTLSAEFETGTILKDNRHNVVLNFDKDIYKLLIKTQRTKMENFKKTILSLITDHLYNTNKRISEEEINKKFKLFNSIIACTFDWIEFLDETEKTILDLYYYRLDSKKENEREINQSFQKLNDNLKKDYTITECPEKIKEFEFYMTIESSKQMMKIFNNHNKILYSFNEEISRKRSRTETQKLPTTPPRNASPHPQVTPGSSQNSQSFMKTTPGGGFSKMKMKKIKLSTSKKTKKKKKKRKEKKIDFLK